MNNLILYPIYHAEISNGKTNISKSLVELCTWAKEEKAESLMIRREDINGSVMIKHSYVYYISEETTFIKRID
jgi:hypothetical protein